MKVVQLLYSYLLTKCEFKINPAPANPTKDRAFAHTIYIDLLLTILELGGFKTFNGSVNRSSETIPSNPRFNQSKMMRALASNEDIRSIINKATHEENIFEKVLPQLYNAIIDSEIYKKYLRARNRGLQEDVEFWSVVINTIIAVNPAFIEAARGCANFTIKGLEEGVRDVVATINDFNDQRNALSVARNSLDHSLNKAYELYHALLALPVELTRAYDLKLEAGRNKFQPTAEDLNPNTKLLNNKLLPLLESNEDIRQYAEQHPNQWEGSDILIDHLLDKILKSDLYAQYISDSKSDIPSDTAFWRQVMKNIILPDDELAEALENKSVFWNDDIEIMGTFALKTLKRFGSDDEEVRETAILPEYKDEEDRRFGPDLFVDVIEHYDEYRQMIDAFINTKQWDAERLAFMDVVIMVTAIAEMLNYPQIPLAVTLNEYIEIANSYSTPKSGKFVNGVLYSVINKLKEEGRLQRN